MKDAYVHLGIQSSATIEEIEAAYENKKRLFDASRFPEGSPEREDARRMMTVIELAYHFAVASYYAPVKRGASETSVPVVPQIAKTKSHLKIVLAVIVSLALSLGLFGIYVIYAVTRIKSSEPAQSGKLAAQEILQTAQPASPASLVQQPDQTELADRLLQSTVFVEVGTANRKTGSGSGFFVNKKGDVLTNYHVVEGVGQILVTLRNGDSRWAKIRAFDKDRDMALLALEPPIENANPLPRSNSLPRQGEGVLAAGAPKGLVYTVSNGIVSAVRQNKVETFIQITAPVSPGSSGGPVLNLKGEIIGMATMILEEGQNLNFAVASTVFNDFIAYAERQTPIPSSPRSTYPRPSPSQKSSSTRQPSQNGSGIPLPAEEGFMGHRWGSSVQDLKKRLSGLKLLETSGACSRYSTGNTFAAFEIKTNVGIAYEFYKNKLCRITFLKMEQNVGEIVQSIYDELVTVYGIEGEEIETENPDYELYAWKSGDLLTALTYVEERDTFWVDFMYWPLWKNTLEE
jgi:S1-C subfamily serine protease